MKSEHVKLSAEKADVKGDDLFKGVLGKGIEEKPVWAGLYESFRDALFPSKLPPLELMSTPISAPDPMAGKTNPWAIGTATIANACAVAIFILMGLNSTMHHLPTSAGGDNIHLSDFTLFAPSNGKTSGGGGGGSNELIDPIAGRLPKRDTMPIAPAQVPVLENPTLAMDPAIAVPIEIKMPENPSLQNIGVHASPNVKLASNGPGTESGLGTGSNGGVGPGKGPGYGPGSDGGIGGSVYRAGVGGVSYPIPIVSPEAEFSDEARRNKYQGVCMISIIVDARGYPRNPRVIRSLGMGLDEKALEAVERYRFKPAMKEGKPVPVMIEVEVNFRLY